MRKRNKTEASELKSHIGYHLRVVSNAVSLSFSKKLADYDVTVAEWVILREMYSNKEDKTAPSVVAEMTGLTRGAVSKLIERLLQKGFVSRSEASHDRRYQDILLTSKAVKLVPRLASIADENDHRFFSKLTASERSVLKTTLLKLAKIHDLQTNPIN